MGLGPQILISGFQFSSLSPAGNYMFKVNYRNIRKRCEICSKLTIKTPKPRQWHCSGVFIVNFEHISYFVLVLLLLALSLAAGPDLMSSVILEVNVIMKLN